MENLPTTTRPEKLLTHHHINGTNIGHLFAPVNIDILILTIPLEINVSYIVSRHLMAPYISMSKIKCLLAKIILSKHDITYILLIINFR
jgi:hypothetical protein